jgi:hypothetical protein
VSAADLHNLELEEPENISETKARNVAASAGGSTGIKLSLPHDDRHLAGTTQHAFEAQQRERNSEKTTEEKTEEEIVMQYVKKQSLMEFRFQSKGKARAIEVDS